MHQSILPPPPPPRAHPGNLPFFFVMNGKFPGAGALKPSNASVYRMNQPVVKRDNSSTLNAPDLALLEFQI